MLTRKRRFAAKRSKTQRGGWPWSKKAPNAPEPIYRYDPTPHGIEVLKQHIKELEARRDEGKGNTANTIKKLHKILDDFNKYTKSYEKNMARQRQKEATDSLAPAIATRQNQASQKRVLETEAEEFLREHRVNPDESRLSYIKQAQLLTEALRALKAKGKNVNTYMSKPDRDDLVAGPYTFRMHTNENAKNSGFQAGLYVFKTTDPENDLLIYPK
jgi:hypothetical protein